MARFASTTPGAALAAVGVWLLSAACSPSSPQTTTHRTAGAGATSTSEPGGHRIAAGEGHTCVVLRDETVSCWGRDAMGQSVADARPARVAGLTGVRTLFAAGTVSCAHTRLGVSCWGANMFGQLHMPPSWDYVKTPEPWTPVDGHDVREGALGMQGACAIDRGVWCWGEIGASITPSVGTRFGPVPTNEQGRNEIGGGGTAGPRRVDGLDGAVQVAIGAKHVCARFADGTVRCLGSNQRGQLGRVVQPLDAYHPAALVEDLTDVVELEANLGVTCARTSRGEVHCWGSNHAGQLGVRDESKLIPFMHYVTLPGDPHDRFWPKPLRVEGLPPVKRLSVGAMHVCAVGEDSRVYCWGANEGGQLGDGTVERRGTPVAMRDITGAVDVAAGAFGPKGHTCVLLEGGAVKCVGQNGRGELGVSDPKEALTPVEVVGL